MSRVTALAAALAMTLAVPAGADDPYTVDSHCGWVLTNEPNTTDIVLVLVAEAHAAGPLPAATTSVTCTVENRFRETLTATGSMVGNHVYAVSSRVMRLAPPSYCVSATAVWVDATAVATHTAEDPEHCEDADW